MFKKEFDSSFAGFMTDGAKWLVENTDIKLIGRRWKFRFLSFSYLHCVSETVYYALWNPGLDYLSFAAFEESPATHRVILKGRVSIYLSL